MMRFQQAEAAHEPDLRRLMADDPMPGAFRLAYTREPDFSHALDVQGTSTQVIAALEDGKVVGMGVRAILPVHVNGAVREVGYLGGLRSLTSARRGLGLARGFQFLRKLHEDGRVPGYLTTILEDNVHALAMLQSGRAGLPRYVDLGRYTTFALFPNRFHRAHPSDCRILRCPEVPLGDVLAFLRAETGRRPFSPAIGESLGGPWYRDFREEDLRIATRGQTIVGVAGVWDQSAFKQVRVAGYAPWLGLARPMVNAALRLTGYPTLPPAGGSLQPRTLAFTTVKDDDPQVFRALLEAALEAMPTLLLVGLHEKDPLRAGLRGLRAVPYHARLCWVCWDDGIEAFRSFDLTEAPYLELARL